MNVSLWDLVQDAKLVAIYNLAGAGYSGANYASIYDVSSVKVKKNKEYSKFKEEEILYLVSFVSNPSIITNLIKVGVSLEEYPELSQYKYPEREKQQTMNAARSLLDDIFVNANKGKQLERLSYIVGAKDKIVTLFREHSYSIEHLESYLGLKLILKV